MYSTHFGLTADPFLPLSDPEEIYPSSQVREAVHHFLYARKSHHALFLLTGEIGTGKTTAVSAILRELPEGTPVAKVSPATSRPGELLDEVFQGFGLPKKSRETKPQRLRRLEAELARLHEQGGQPVIVLDEAHLVPDGVLEMVRLMTNLHHGRHPAMQVVLVGQPELAERLRAHRLRPLRQRITLRYTMLPLTEDETELYLIERLRHAGSEAPQRVFDGEAVRAIYAATSGIPREINVRANQAMMNAFVESSTLVRAAHVRAAESEFAFEGVAYRSPPGDGPEAGVAEARPAPEEALHLEAASSAKPPLADGPVSAPGPSPARAWLRELPGRAWKRASGRRAPLRLTLGFLLAGSLLAGILGFRDVPLVSVVSSLAESAGAREEETASGSLDERQPSALEVESAMPAVVWLGDRRLGLAPGRFSPVPPGKHELRIDAGDGRVFSKSVIVTPGSTTYVRARALSPR